MTVIPSFKRTSISQVDDWVEVLIISSASGKITVRVASKTVAVAETEKTNNDFREYYVGGVPEELRTR